MKKVLSRTLLLLLAVLLAAAAFLPAFAEDDDRIVKDPKPDLKPHPGPQVNIPWWEISPPKQPKPRTRTVVRQAETLIETIDAEGLCYTAIKQVNVRSQPSTYATKVMTIRSAGTEFSVSARVKNSSGEIWYAVLLANGTLGYIRSDLLNTDHVILLGDPYSYEADVTTRPAAASESGSDVINIVTSPGPDPTPQVIYIVSQPAAQPTPTPIYVYVTPEPAQGSDPQVTPQVIYIYPDSGK